MPTPDWRAEKASAIIKHLCHIMVRAKAQNVSTLPDPIPVSRSELSGLLWDATKLYCDANEELLPDRVSTWSPELPAFLLDHPERCEESLGIVADQDYRDPYYDRPMDEGIIPDLSPPPGYVMELRHQGTTVVRSGSLRGLAVKLSDAGLESEVYLTIRNTFLKLTGLPNPNESVTIFPEWQIWIVVGL
jgi:hypothetical protein